MPCIDFIFVSPDGFIHQAIGGVVRVVTKSNYAHAAIRLSMPEYEEPIIAEMLGLGLLIQDGKKYDHEETMCMYSLQFSDENYLSAQEMIREWIAVKVKYGLFTDCISTGIAERFGDKYGEEWHDHVGRFYNTMMCSELATRIIRLEYTKMIYGLNPDLVSPRRLLDAIQVLMLDEIYGKVDTP